MRRWMAVAVALAIAGTIGVPLIVRAASSNGINTYSIDHQQFQWSKQTRSTSSTHFRALKLSAAPSASKFIIAKGPISAMFSGKFEGALVDIRVRDGKKVFHPGAVGVDPGVSAFSFVRGGTPKPTFHFETVEWRSPTGATVTLKKGDLIVTFLQKQSSGGPPVTC